MKGRRLPIGGGVSRRGGSGGGGGGTASTQDPHSVSAAAPSSADNASVTKSSVLTTGDYSSVSTSSMKKTVSKSETASTATTTTPKTRLPRSLPLSRTNSTSAAVNPEAASAASSTKSSKPSSTSKSSEEKKSSGKKRNSKGEVAAPSTYEANTVLSSASSPRLPSSTFPKPTPPSLSSSSGVNNKSNISYSYDVQETEAILRGRLIKVRIRVGDDKNNGKASGGAAAHAATTTTRTKREATAKNASSFDSSAAASSSAATLHHSNSQSPSQHLSDSSLHKRDSFIGNDGNKFYCQVCGGFGEIVCCDGCPRVYHPDCISSTHPSRLALDRDDDPWFCPECLEGMGGSRESTPSNIPKSNNSKAAAKQQQETATNTNTGSKRRSPTGYPASAATPTNITKPKPTANRQTSTASAATPDAAADTKGASKSTAMQQQPQPKYQHQEPHFLCIDCNKERDDLTLISCDACGHYVHYPSCTTVKGDTDTNNDNTMKLCGTCRAVDEEDDYDDVMSEINEEEEEEDEEEEEEAEPTTTSNSAKKKDRRIMMEEDGGGDDDDDDEEEEDEEDLNSRDDDELFVETTPLGSRRKRNKDGTNGAADVSSASKKEKKKKRKKNKKSTSPSPSPTTAAAGSSGNAASLIQSFASAAASEATAAAAAAADAEALYHYRAAHGLAQATPAFYFYLNENRWKIERVLARNHRYFNRLPKGPDRNELVAKEAALWWSKLRPADHRRYMNMSMRDFESQIIEWKEDKNLQDMGLGGEDEWGGEPLVDSLDDSRMTYEKHERLFLSTSVGSKPFNPEPDQNYNRVLLDLLHDTRFHPLPLFSVNRPESDIISDDHTSKVTIPFFEVHGPISTSVGDECLGCTRGWLHFCPVVQRRVPAVEHRAKLQAPLSSLVATRVGLGLRPRLEREEVEEELPTGKEELFAWRPSDELKDLKNLPVLPCCTLSNSSERADDVAHFIEETMAMKVPEPPRPKLPESSGGQGSSTAAFRKLPIQRKEDDPEVHVYKCGRCRTIIYNDTGCVQCRRAQLVINTTKRNISLDRSSRSSNSRSAKVRTVMLGRVAIKDGMEEKPSEGDISVSNGMLRERWTPYTILPPERTPIPRPKSPDEAGEEPDEDVEGSEEEGEDEPGVTELETTSEDMEMEEENTPRRPQRSARSTAPFSDVSESDRDRIARENKKKSDELYKKTLSIACCGMLLALRRRDPLLLFAEPAAAEGYSDVVKNPIDFGKIRRDVLREKYSSLGAFIGDVKLLCDNAVAFNPAVSIYSKTAAELFDLVNVMHKRASNWMGAVMDAYKSFLFRQESRKKNPDDVTNVEPEDEPPGPFESLRIKWPQAVAMLDNGEWLKCQLESDFMRTHENETAYYGSLAVHRVAAAAEASLAPYTDTAGGHSVVSKRSYKEDELLREIIDERVSALTHPMQLKDVSTWREEAVVRLLRKVQSRRLDRRFASENGCSRCDSVKPPAKALELEFAHPGRLKRKDEGDLPRVDPSRISLTTGLGSAKTCEKIEKRHEDSETKPEDSLADVCISVRGSKIHGWGLFADQQFKKGDVVAEYIGEYVANPVADAREKVYQDHRIQDYQFRLDEKLIIDATLKGGHGRYINHNCSPNCYAKIIPGREPKPDLKRVIIIALRNIDINEEISYDYQFPLEMNLSNRIPCNCQSEACRGFMNWDIPEKGSNNRALLIQKRGANMRDRIRRLGRPLKRDEHD